MKRLVSILLLIIFLFNVGGYYLVFVGIKHRSNQLLTEKIESNRYNANEIVELKIPVTLPYPLQQNGFERIEGKFEHNGNFYKLVKQKLENDTVYIVCIRDTESKQLVKTLKDYVAKTNEVPANSKSTLKFLKDFESHELAGFEGTSAWTRDIGACEITLSSYLTFIAQDAPPPKA